GGFGLGGVSGSDKRDLRSLGGRWSWLCFVVFSAACNRRSFRDAVTAPFSSRLRKRRLYRAATLVELDPRNLAQMSQVLPSGGNAWSVWGAASLEGALRKCAWRGPRAFSGYYVLLCRRPRGPPSLSGPCGAASLRPFR